MYYKTYQYNGYGYNNKTLETLNKNPDAMTIIDNNMIIVIINNIEMYVFPINTNYDNMFVKYTTTKTPSSHSLELWYANDDLLYPTHNSLQSLYTKTMEILNNK
jgi:hypothetical protein